jgi:hypothetical protein
MSLVFDGNKYTERLRQVRLGSALPSLVERYALDQRHLNVSDGELFGWIEQVVGLWHRQADHGVATIVDVCAQLLADDEKLRRTRGYQDAEWWRDLVREAWPAASDPPARPGAADPAAKPPGLADAEPRPATGPIPAPRSPAPPSPPRPPRYGGRPIPDRRSPRGQPTAGAESRQPPAPPALHVTTDQRGDRVIVRWQVPPDASATVEFEVERLAGPGIEGRRWRTARTAVEDLEPPTGRPLTYQVVTQDPDYDGPSKGIHADVVFTPPVTGLVARQVSNGGVTGRWRARADVWETQVWRTPAGTSADPADGAPIPSQADRFHDRGAPPGRHVYSVVPIYQDPESRRAYPGEYSSVEVEVFDRPPQPRADVDGGQQHGASDVVLRWDQLPPGASLLLRRAAAEPAGAAGESLTLEDACSIGEPVADGEALTGTTGCVTLPAGRWLLVPFSVAGNLAVRGRSITVVVVPPVSNPEAVRTGPKVLVSWEWPEGLGLARVVWRTGGAEVVREVTISEFRRLGAVAFSGSDAAEAQISGVVRSGTDVLTSAPVTAPVTAQTPTLTFHVQRVWPWQLRRTRPYRLHGPRWWCARRRIVIMADLPCAVLRLEMYARSPAGGANSEKAVCAIDDLELGPGRPHEVSLDLPDLSAMDRPRYLACRAETLSGPIRVDEFASTGREIRPCFR